MRMGLAMLLLAVLGFPSADAAEPVIMALHETPRALPKLAFTNGDGEPQTLEAWRGQVVLLNVWATWCGPCREEMPTLDRLQARLGGDHLEVVALSIDRGGIDVVHQFFAEIGLAHLRIFIDDSGRAARDLKIFGLPATILVGPAGNELGRLVGPAEWDTPAMVAFFEGVIATFQEGYEQ